MIHQSHERTRYISKPKTHCQPLVQSKFGFKSGFPLITPFDSNLVISAF